MIRGLRLVSIRRRTSDGMEADEPTEEEAWEVGVELPDFVEGVRTLCFGGGRR